MVFSAKLIDYLVTASSQYVVVGTVLIIGYCSREQRYYSIHGNKRVRVLVNPIVEFSVQDSNCINFTHCLK